MTRIAKLYGKFLNKQELTFSEFQKLLEAFGYRLDRVRGSHHTYRHSAIGQRMQIQPKGKAAKDYQLVQFRNIVEEYGLGLDDSE
jgi:predicted RNA binding protein YcfA (HicA-like mRNA interferase family)